MTNLPPLERDLDADADTHPPAGETPRSCRRGHRVDSGVAIALSVAIAVVVAVVALSLRHSPTVRTQTGSNLVAVGSPVLVSVIGEHGIPHGGTLSYLVGQAPVGVRRIELLGLHGSRTLRLSAAHMFLVTFTPTARGRVELRAALSDGRTLTNAFTLPLSSAQMLAFSDRYRRPGAVFNGEIGEHIVGTPYREIMRRFGQPLATLSNGHGTRCVYYAGARRPRPPRFGLRSTI